MINFLTVLRKLVTSCNSADADSVVRERLCMGVKDRSIQQPLLKVTYLTLETAVDIVLSEEASSRDKQLMGHQDTEGTASAVSQCVESSDAGSPIQSIGAAQPRGPVGGEVCQFCVLLHSFVRAQRPAWGSVPVCGDPNHSRQGWRAHNTDQVLLRSVPLLTGTQQQQQHVY